MAFWSQKNLDAKHTKIHVALPPNKSDAMLFRTISQQSLVFSGKDGGVLYYINRPLFLQWYQQALELNSVHQKAYCGEGEVQFALKYKATHLLCNNTQRLNQPIIHLENDLILYALNNK